MQRFLLFYFILFALNFELGTLNCIYAGVPNVVNYQGRYREYGQPVTGTHTMRFKVFDASSNGNLLWDSGDLTVAVTNGLFSVPLTPSVDMRAQSTGVLFLEMSVIPTGSSSYKTLTPREQLTSNWYVLHAMTAEDIEKSTGSIHFAIGASTCVVISPQGRITMSQDTSSPAPAAGTIHWSGTNFEGYDGSVWKPLDVQATAGGSWTEDAGNNKVYLTSSGRNVGVGTANPAGTMHIANSGGSSQLILQEASDDAAAPSLLSQKTRGTLATPQNIQPGDSLFQLRLLPWVNSGPHDIGEHINIMVDGSPSGNYVPTMLQLCTSSTTSNSTPKLTVKPDGKVGIGTTAPVDTLEVNGGITCSYGFYHDRGDVTSYDYTVSNLTTDGNWHTLDLSAIVPSGTKAVLLSVIIQDNNGGHAVSFANNNYANSTVNSSSIRNQQANVEMIGEFIVSVGSDRKIKYVASNYTWDIFNIVVKGWWK